MSPISQQSITHRFLLDEKLCVLQMASDVLAQAFSLLFIQHLCIEHPHLRRENVRSREKITSLAWTKLTQCATLEMKKRDFSLVLRMKKCLDKTHLPWGSLPGAKVKGAGLLCHQVSGISGEAEIHPRGSLGYTEPSTERLGLFFSLKERLFFNSSVGNPRSS